MKIATSPSGWLQLFAAALPFGKHLSSARFAVSALFFVNGTLISSWVSRIPAIEARHGLGHGSLGLVLLAAAAGAMVAMPLAGWLIPRVGSALIAKIATLGYCALLPGLAVAWTPAALMAALCLFGAFHGALDVAMNAQAVVVEEKAGRAIMSSFHALFSAGGLAGASLGGAMASLGIGPAGHFLIAALLLGGVTFAVVPHLLPQKATADVRDSRASQVQPWRNPTLVALGAMAFCLMMSEGAMADWSALFLTKETRSSESVAALGYAAFSITMSLGRAIGDRLTRLIGPVRLVRIGGITAATGMTLALVFPHPMVALIGFGFVGLGCAAIVPLAFSGAGRVRGTNPGVAVATVTTLGYFGFLIGPPAIGFLAEAIGLRKALGIIAISSVSAVMLAPAADERLRSRRGASPRPPG